MIKGKEFTREVIIKQYHEKLMQIENLRTTFLESVKSGFLPINGSIQDLLKAYQEFNEKTKELETLLQEIKELKKVLGLEE